MRKETGKSQIEKEKCQKNEFLNFFENFEQKKHHLTIMWSMAQCLFADKVMWYYTIEILNLVFNLKRQRSKFLNKCLKSLTGMRAKYLIEKMN